MVKIEQDLHWALWQ